MSGVLLQVGVKIFLNNGENRYLLLERSPEKYPNIKNNWDIPGGRIVPGTSLEENLRREVLEETGLEISGNIELIGAQDIIRLPEKHIVRLTYKANVSGTPKLDHESVNFKWATKSEMLSMVRLDEFSREILEKGLLS